MEELVTLIERPQISLQKILRNCQYCQKIKQIVCHFDQTSICGYQKVMHFIYPTSCVQKTKKTHPTIQQSATHSMLKDSLKPTGISDTKMTSDTDKEQQTPSVETSTSESEHVSIVPTPVLQTSDKVKTQEITKQDPVIKPSTSDSVVTEYEGQTIPESTAFESKREDDMEKRDDSVSGEKSNYNDCLEKGGTVIAGSGDVESSCTMGPEVVEVRPSTPSKVVPEQTQADGASGRTDENVKQEEKGDKSQADPPNVEKEQEQAEPPQTQPDQASQQEGVKVEQDTNENGMKNIYAEEPLTDPNDLDLESLALPDTLEEPIQKLSSKNKETAFMRLKNRIKELELNLNLSSRYVLFLFIRCIDMSTKSNERK